MRTPARSTSTALAILALAGTSTTSAAYSPGLVDAPQAQIGIDPARAALSSGAEHIDLFSGALNLSYGDHCIPGAFGLDMCVQRTYSSKIWNENGDIVGDDAWAGLGWSIHPGGRMRFDSALATSLGGNYYLWLQLPGGAMQRAHHVDSASDYYREAGDANEFPDMDASYNEMFVTQDFTFVYRTGGNEYRAITTEGVVHVFDASASHADGWTYGTSITNAYGDEITVSYDTACTGTVGGALDSMTDALGRQIDFSTDANCMIDGFDVTDVGGNTVSFDYTVSGGELIEVVLPTGEATAYTYDGTNGELTDIELPTGGTTTYTYDTVEFLWDTSGTTDITYETEVVDTKTVSPDSATAHVWDFDFEDYAVTGTASDASRTNSVTLPDGTLVEHDYHSACWHTSGSALTVCLSNTVGRPYQTRWYESSSASTPLKFMEWSWTDSGSTTSGLNGVELSTYADPFHTLSYHMALVPYWVGTVYDSSSMANYAPLEVNGLASAGDLDDYANVLFAYEAAYVPYWSAVAYTSVTESSFAWSTESVLEGWNRVRLPETTSRGAGSAALTSTWSQVDRSYSTSVGTEGWLTAESHTTSGTEGVTSTSNASDDETLDVVYTITPSTGELEIELDRGGLLTETRSYEYGGLAGVSLHDGAATLDVYAATIDSATGLVTTVADGDGNSTDYDYDGVGRLVEVAPALDDPTLIAYDLASTPPTIEVAVGSTSRVHTYDGLGRLIQSDLVVGGSVVSTDLWELDFAGRTEVAYLPHDSLAGGYSESTYDGLGRRTALDITDGSTTLFRASSFAWPAVTDTDGRSVDTVHTLDGYGRRLQTDAPDGVDTLTLIEGTSSYHYGGLTNIYDSSGALVHQQVQYLDDQGRVWSIYDSDAGQHFFQTDAAGNQVCEWDANGDTQVTAYDFAGRPESLSFDTSCTLSTGTSPSYEWVYDGDAPSLAPSGWTASNSTGRQSGTRDPAGGTQLSYDAQGRVDASLRYFRRGSQRADFDLSYGYDSEGNPDEIGLSDGGMSWTIRTEYGVAGRVESIAVDVADSFSGSASWDVLDGASYHPDGRIDTLEFSNGVDHAVGLDGFGRPETITTSGASTELDLSYGYDGNHNITSITDAAATDSYTYDDLNRLTAVAYGDDSTSLSYTWDEQGNLTDRGGSAATSLGIDFGTRSFSSNQEASTSTSYDSAGMLTDDGSVTFTHDPRGKILTATASSGASYRSFYDVSGRVVLERFQTAAGTKSFRLKVWDELGLLRAVFTATAASSLPRLSHLFVYAGATPVAVLHRDTSAPYGNANNFDLVWLHADLQGTTRLATDESATVVFSQELTPFGEERSSSGTAPTDDHLFAGHESYNDYGLSNMGSRSLNQSLVGFTSADRAFLGDPTVPQSLNRRMYGLGNPLSHRDPTGDMAVPNLRLYMYVSDQVTAQLVEVNARSRFVAKHAPSGGGRAAGELGVVATAVAIELLNPSDPVTMFAAGGLGAGVGRAIEKRLGKAVGRAPAMQPELPGGVAGDIARVTKSLDEIGGLPSEYSRRGYVQGRKVFKDKEGALPTPVGKWREADVGDIRVGPGGIRGSQRVVYDEAGNVHYTSDHYKSWTLIRTGRK